MPSQAERAAALARAGQLHNAGDLSAAATIYRSLLAVEPHNDRALFLLGLVEHQRGNQPSARTHFERLVALARDVADYHLWFARVLQAQGELDAALVEVRRCRALSPGLVSAIHTESQLLRSTQQLQAARTLLSAAIEREPTSALLHADLGETHLALGAYAAGRAALERAIELDAGMFEAWINLGVALQALGHQAAAGLAFEQALRLAPENADAHYTYGVALENNGTLEHAIEQISRALQLQPERGEWQSALAGLRSEVGELDQAVQLYRQGLAVKPDPVQHSSLVALLQYLPCDPQERRREAQAWAALYAPAQSENAPRPRAAAPLRVGFVSADFRQHSVAYFLEPLFVAFDASRIAVTCYANSNESDAVTARLAERARMRSVVALSDAQLAQQIRADGVDVLIDLSGHTIGHRLGVFAHTPAPLQLAYLGYPGTTGVPAIRFRLTDARLDPPRADAHYSERLYRLPRTFCSFQPPRAAPAVSPLPAAKTGQLTFGSLNKYMKVTEPVLQSWARILKGVPHSRLVLQSRIFVDPLSCERVRRRFGELGVSAERLLLYGTMGLEQHLRMYEQIDIGLDPFPWNGHTTTCLALHMGVPVLTLAGDFGASRMGVSVLSAAGLPDWIAPDQDTYVATAQRWADQLRPLAELRAGLRAQLARSELCEGPSLARAFEEALQTLIAGQG